MEFFTIYVYTNVDSFFLAFKRNGEFAGWVNFEMLWNEVRAPGSVEIEKLCKSLEKKDNSNAIFQIRKSSSSVFANISEAQYPQSLPDMLSKFKIARKECVETESWLKLLFDTDVVDEKTFKDKRNLCGRIQRMLTSSCITIEKKINK